MHNYSALASLSCTAVAIATLLGSAAVAVPLSPVPVTASELQATPVQVMTAQATTKSVKVFFPKDPSPRENFTYVEPVWRRTTSAGVAQFALEQLIAGPTRQEQAIGLRGPIRLQGRSTCGKDFTLAINTGVARLKFCRPVVSAGVGDDARLNSAVSATLKQFSTVRSVIILDHRGNCLGDMSGENLCLRR